MPPSRRKQPHSIVGDDAEIVIDKIPDLVQRPTKHLGKLNLKNLPKVFIQPFDVDIEVEIEDEDADGTSRGLAKSRS